MVQIVTEDSGGVGLQKLLHFFKSCWFDPKTKRIRANDFSDLGDYYLKKGLIAAIASTRDRNNATPAAAVEFLVSVLDNNDNTDNPFSDTDYIVQILKVAMPRGPACPLGPVKACPSRRLWNMHCPHTQIPIWPLHSARPALISPCCARALPASGFATQLFGSGCWSRSTDVAPCPRASPQVN